MEEKGKSVLVVEDDENIATIVSNTLEKLGYRVIRAWNAALGEDLAGKADIVFLDLRLPDHSGEELLETIRAKGNYVPVVVMSAAVSRKDAIDRLKKLGIVDFMEKPFSLREIADKAGKAAELADKMGFVGKATDRLRGFIERQNRP